MSNKVTQYLRNSNAVLLAFLMLFSAQAYGQEAPKAEAEPTGHYGDIVYGDPNAPVEIIEYASMTCGHCKDFATTVFPLIKQKYIDTGKARLVFRNFVLNGLDMAASLIARCKTEDVAKSMTKMLFDRQAEWARSNNPIGTIVVYSSEWGINRNNIQTCMENKALGQSLVETMKEGEKLYHIHGTPTVVINGTVVKPTLVDMIKAIEGQL